MIRTENSVLNHHDCISISVQLVEEYGRSITTVNVGTEVCLQRNGVSKALCKRVVAA